MFSMSEEYDKMKNEYINNEKKKEEMEKIIQK